MSHGNEYSAHIYTDVVLQANDVLPIKTFPSFEVDPLAAITASLTKLEKTRAVIQFLVRPIFSSWYSKAQNMQITFRMVAPLVVWPLINGVDESPSETT